MKLVLFDDNKWENFFPITLCRSTGDLRLGVLKLRQRLNAYFGQEIKEVVIHPLLKAVYKERHPEWTINSLEMTDTIFINTRLKISDALVGAINNLQENTCLTHKNEILAARFTPDVNSISAEELPNLFKSLEKIKWDNDDTWKYLWELISANAEYISRDFQDIFYDKDNFFETDPGVTILNPYNIWLGEGVSIAPGVILDASEGPVIIDENARIMPNAVLIGPVYVGKSSLIKVGAKIYEGTSIGPVCKIGGEVEATIFQAFTNKQHDGFLRHSYLGEWINLGADTNNSDLRNDYQEVASYFYPKLQKIKTGCQFLGTIIGDHSKTGINCTINTGTTIGVGCNLYGKDIIRDFIPSFSWGEPSQLTEYRLDKFDETVEKVKARRHLKYSKAEKELYSNIRKIVLD
ncbi:MAG TPA: putative sugar nucleotidyl transferase [Candidatus Cloacimonadota bacterium]|nr:putative sugar nucleotidyl transferase [Candidatus Cloacimonadota bacterium]